MSASLTDEQAEKAGQEIVKLFNLKEAYQSKGKKYNPPRYYTDWGTKSAIGIFLSVQRIVEEAGKK